VDADFWHFNLGNLLTILSFIVGGIWFITTMKGDMKELSVLTELRLTHLEASNDDQKEEIKKLAAVLITLGRYEERFLRVEQMIDDLRRGRGIIGDR
jgi:K+/H+ antiporter YhaU regulatory subunit KhtT